MSEKYVTIEDTVWPVNLNESAWLLRYGPHHDYHAASAVDAFCHLMSPGITQTDAIAALKRGRRATAAAVTVEEP